MEPEYPDIENILPRSFAYKLVTLEEVIHNKGGYDEGYAEYIQYYAECDEFEYRMKEYQLERIDGECDTEYDEHGSTQIYGWVVYKAGMFYIRIRFSGDVSWGDGAQFDDYHYVTQKPVTKIQWTKAA